MTVIGIPSRMVPGPRRAPGGTAWRPGPGPGAGKLEDSSTFSPSGSGRPGSSGAKCPPKRTRGGQRRIREETPLGDQKPTKNRVFHDFFGVAPSGIPWESPGSPNDPPRAIKRHQNDTKTMRTGFSQSVSQPASQSISQSVVQPIRLFIQSPCQSVSQSVSQLASQPTHPSTDHFVRARWREGRRQVDYSTLMP